MSFRGWKAVSKHILKTLDSNERLNSGQKSSVGALIERLPNNGVIIADEVGMGKTRIAVELIHSVKNAGGRVLVVVPTTLGFQWQSELNDRAKNLAPKAVIKSLWSFLGAYEGDSSEPWDKEQVVILSQSFANWRMGPNSRPSRWALLPEIYAQWRKNRSSKGRLPNGYNSHNDLESRSSKVCAEHIVESAKGLPTDHPIQEALSFIGENFIWGKGSFGGESFYLGGLNRELLEKAIGIALGQFDFIVIDEAHKGRNENSSLSAILNRIVIKSAHARSLAMTATPVELGVGQWEDVFNRINLPDAKRDSILKIVYDYAHAVSMLKQGWRVDEKVRVQFELEAKKFKSALSPYLVRRDKRQDKTVRDFCLESGLPINAYRQQKPIHIEVNTLTNEWKKTVCLVEGLSAASSMQIDATSKRARLTFANGHGLAAIIDQSLNASESSGEDEVLEIDEQQVVTQKKSQRQAWWKSCIANTFESGEESLYNHPAILKVIEEIERDLVNGQKVLVFGKLTRPMRALVNLLNARAMLVSLEQERYWPQSKVHIGDGEHNIESEVKAVEVALKQLGFKWNIETVNQLLAKQYNKGSRLVEKAKEQLIDKIERARQLFDTRTDQLFETFKASVNAQLDQEKNSLTPFANAIFELIDKEGFDFTPEEMATGFNDLMSVVTAKHEGDENGDGVLDAEEAKDLWQTIETRVRNEFAHVRGGMARLMYGGTEAYSRRVMQMGFNRMNSNPRVIVAQSVVGREGLNLHQACRIVYLLHPEWNPGVVEQQIGRVDRLKSRWEKEFEEHLANKKINKQSELPFIEIKPVIFKGTYDEHNWQVLNTRWEELRSQLHGVVIPETERDEPFEELYDEIAKLAPTF